MPSASRPFELVRTADQWSRSACDGVFLDPASEAVELAWTLPPQVDLGGEPPPAGAGMAFDAECRLYRSVPGEGRVERVLWRAADPLAPSLPQPAPVDLFEAPPPEPLGDFASTEPAGALREPRGVAVDGDDRLFVAEAGAGRVLVHDLWSRRLLRAAELGGGRRPLDLASDGHTVWVAAGAGGLLTMTAREGPADVALPAGAGAPERIAVSPGGAVVLLAGAGTAAARVVPLDRPGEAFGVPGATDLEWEGEGVLVVARLPGEDFLRFRMAAGSRVALPPYAARRYDGTGIARDPDGGIGFWTEGGFRHATAARLRYAADGRVTTYRLDSGEYQTTWGRLFVDACIPAGTSVWARCVTADETFDGPVLPRTAPGNVEAGTIPRPDLSPPMPPLSLVEQGGEWHPLHRRETGREQAWVQPGDDDPYATYEAPVIAAPGRFLWVALELRGNTRLTPRVRCLRVERSAHDWLRRLPRAFSREDEVAGFLGRFLAIFEGTLGEMEGRAALREALLDPAGTPQDMLPWLASFLGLALDRRWPVAARRTLVAEAAWLFRFRGTVRGLSRWLEIYLGVPVFLVELFRLRGTGGTLGGEADLPASSSAVLGAGFRVGGAVGVMEESPLAGSTDDAFRTHAHRFTVIVPRLLSEEQRAVVEDVLQVHRPAHTLFDVCTPGAGMRIGRRLHLGLSSVIGRTGGFGTLRLGGSALGREAVLGRPVPATRAGASRLGADSRAG